MRQCARPLRSGLAALRVRGRRAFIGRRQLISAGGCGACSGVASLGASLVAASGASSSSEVPEERRMRVAVLCANKLERLNGRLIGGLFVCRLFARPPRVKLEPPNPISRPASYRAPRLHALRAGTAGAQVAAVGPRDCSPRQIQIRLRAIGAPICMLIWRPNTRARKQTTPGTLETRKQSTSGAPLT